MVFRTFIFLAIGQKLDFWIVYDLDSVDTAEVAGRPIDESFLENIDTDFAVHFFVLKKYALLPQNFTVHLET